MRACAPALSEPSSRRGAGAPHPCAPRPTPRTPRPHRRASLPPRAGLAKLAPAAFDLVVVASAGGDRLRADALAALAKKLRPGGALEVQEVAWAAAAADGAARPGGAAPRVAALRTGDALRAAVVVAGIAPDGAPLLRPVVDDAKLAAAALASLYPKLAASAASPYPERSAEAADALAALRATLAPHLAVAVVTGAAPAYAAGASFSLKSRKKLDAPPPAPPTVPPPAAATAPPADALAAWAAAAASHGTAAASDLIDEDAMLLDEDKERKVVSDCGTGDGAKRKACANCSCGLREELENEADVANGKGAPAKSACGNCAKGDAFRCAGCPHLGTPAFEEGTEGELKLAPATMEKMMDTTGGGGDAVVTAQVGGAVKLGLDDMVDDF